MSKTRIHVVTGVIINDDNMVFVALRPHTADLGNLWEFPGGKVERGETPLQALKRELHEEIGIELVAAEPIMQVDHNYRGRNIFLDVWQVTQYNGEPFGAEGQSTDWVSITTLETLNFPPANLAVIEYLKNKYIDLS